MRNYSIFVASTPKTFLTLLGVEFFISTTLGERYNLGLSILNGFCTVRSEIVFGETGIVQPFSCALYYNFSSMPKTLKNCQAAQGASYAASAHETSIATQAVSQVVNPLFIDVLTQLGEIKNQLTAHYLSSNLQQELCDTEFFELDPLFYDIACKIGAMAQAEMIDNLLFQNQGGQSNE